MRKQEPTFHKAPLSTLARKILGLANKGNDEYRAVIGSSTDSTRRMGISSTRRLAIILALAFWECQAFTVIPSSSRRAALPMALDMARVGRGNRQPPVKEIKPTMNEEIPSKEVRVVVASTTGGKDEALGVMTKEDALARAKQEGGLDLILINNNSDPPVCKIVDYSKYRYMQLKKAKEVKKNSKASEIKEVKMSYKIDVHDYAVRKKNAGKFLQQGNRVKCTVMFRGREVQHDNLGFDLLSKLADELEDVALKEGRPKREGRNLSMILGPRPEVMKAISDGRRAEEKAKKKKKEQELEQRRATKTAQSNSPNTVNLEDDDDDEDDDDYDDDDDDSLDALLGGDDITKDLFT